MLFSLFGRRRRSSSPRRTQFRKSLWTHRTELEPLEARLVLSALPPGFQESFIAGGINPAGADFAPDGTLFVANKGGNIRIIQNDNLLPTPFWSVAVDTFRDRGLTSVCVDPQFATNHFVYVIYTAAVPGNPNAADNGAITKVVRLTASANNPNVADPASVVVLLDNIPSPTGIHTGGFMKFGNDGYLYIGMGEGDIPTLAPDLTSISGKVLRINPRNPAQMIPADNPFVGVSGARGEIYAYGFRNPFSGGIDPVTGEILVNDVGSDKWEEVNHIVPGGNYGWPTAEGISTNPNFINPIYTYSHNGGGAAVVGGVFYHANQFPAEYQNMYFIGDVAQGNIRYVHAEDGDSFVFGTDVPFPTDLDIGPDGSLYYTSVKPGAAGVFKITYTGGNSQQPTAVSTSDVTDGLNPLTVHFSGEDSINPSGNPLSYAWNFGDGTTGTGATPTHIYNVNGTYTVELTVTDTGPGGLFSRAFPLIITVGNRAPQPVITSPLATLKYQAGQTITFTGTATDPDEGVLPASAYHWSFLFGHNTHFHDFIAPIDGATGGSFTIDRIGEPAADQYFRIVLTVTDSQGLSKTVYTDIRPQLSNFTLNTNIPGLVINLDAQPQPSGTVINGVVGMTRTLDAPFFQTVGNQTYVFDSWSDGGLPTHDIDTPVADTTYTANYHLMSTALVATLSGTLPTNWLPGVAQQYTVSVTNSGTETWQAGGATPTHLAAYFNGASDAVGSWSSEPARFNLPQDVAPGQTVNVTVNIAAPTAPGVYTLRNRLVKEAPNVWFDQILKQSTYDGNLLANYSAVVSPYWATGFSSKITVTIKNTGNTIWNAGGTNPVHLGYYFDAPNDNKFAWTSEPVRVNLPNDVNPGQTVTFSFTAQTPAAAGAHVLRYRLVKENVAWSDQVGRSDFTAGTLGSAISGPVPVTWTTNETKSYIITLQNTGTMTWPAGGPTPIHLAVYWDATSDAVGAWPEEPVRFNLPNDVAPGASVNVTVTITIPPGAGTHVLRHRLVMENVSWFGAPLVTTTSAGTLVASYSSTAPAVWELGSTKTYQVTVTNTGTATWLATGTTPIMLGAYFDATSDDPYTWTTEPIRFPLTSDLAPGQSQTITVTMTAPNTVGNYILRNRLVKEGVGWFDQLLKTTVTQPALAATYASNPPTNWMTGKGQTYAITITNTGTETWLATGTNRVRLGVYFGGASDASGSAGWTTEPARFVLPNNVAPGQSVTLNVSMTGPAAGNYILRARMVKEGVSWFTYMQKTDVTVVSYHASYSATVPTSFTPAQTRTFNVTLTNTSSVVWNAAGANAVKLGVYFGGGSDAVGSWLAEPKRVSLPADLAPGQSVTLSVMAIAPKAPGSYMLRLRVVKEGVLWFDDMLRTIVTVGSTSTFPPNAFAAAVSAGPPASVAAGTTLSYSYTLTNQGSVAWTATGNSRVRVVTYFTLASAAPPTVSTTPNSSVYLSNTVAGGGTLNQTFTMTAPTAKGTYTLRVRLLSDDGSYSDFVVASNVQVV